MFTVKTFKNVEYKNIAGRPLLLDLHLPAGATAPVPLIFYVHGGGWNSVTKEDATNLEAFIRAGYALSAMDYRYSSEAIFPAQIEDVKDALRHLRAHAVEFGIDPTRIVTWGHSAGAHLVSLLAATGDTGMFDTGLHPGVSARVLGVGAVAAPIDLSQKSEAIENAITALLGGTPSEREQRARAANPITYLTPAAPPFLIIHGTADTAVPPLHSELLHTALQQRAIPSTLILQPGIGHANHNHPGTVRELIRFFDTLTKK